VVGFSQQASNYRDLSAMAQQDLMNTQLATNEPQPPSGVFSIVSDALLPDRTVIDRLGNFDPELYDLRETSNLMKIMTALLGGAGVGGLRKQTAVARLENALHTTHFLDLDRFYGALFGIVRTHAELMPDFGALTDAEDGRQAQDFTITYSLHRDADAAGVQVGTGAFSVGEEFEVTEPALVSSLRYWRQSTYQASSMAIMAVATRAIVDGTWVTPMNAPATPAWHRTDLPSPVVLGPGRYKIVAHFPTSFPLVNEMFAPGQPLGLSSTVGPIRFLSGTEATDGKQATFTAGAALAWPETQAANNASHLVDMIFSVAKTNTVSGGKQFDPYVDAAGSDVWDDVHSRDASYRARLQKFAKALPMGGTYAGLVAAAEAILAVDCQLYESWTWVDDAAVHGGVVTSLGYTWGQVEKGFASWAAVERGHTWATFSGRILQMGRTGTSNRSEVTIVPKRQLRIDEQYELVRVLDRLKPAGVSVLVDPNGVAVHEATAIRTVAADSVYWEITSRVVPNTTARTTGASVYKETDPGKAQPRPAFSQYTGEAWSCNQDVQKVTSYELQSSQPLTASNYETVVFADGTQHAFTPSEALIPGAHTAGARAASDGVLTSYPYAPQRSAPAGVGRR
jgi:hypothetical protein